MLPVELPRKRAKSLVSGLRRLGRPWGWGVTLATPLLFVGALWSGQCFDELQRWLWVLSPYPDGDGRLRQTTCSELQAGGMQLKKPGLANLLRGNFVYF